MARYYGPGTGANRGFWALQWRDIKGRWIEMFGIGKYSIGGITHTGQVVGGDSENSIDVERRTANGKPTETVIDKIDPKTIEMMNVKATLDNAPGFDDDDMRKARNSENNRPKAATYPNGTKLTIDGDEHTKNDSDSWTDPSGDTVKNSDIDSRLDGSEKSSADIPQEADLTQENILSATDGSTLSWNDKTYDRIDGKWYDQKTGKPVSDNTMGKKTEGDLRPDGAEESTPTPTKAAEYEAGTKLRAEKESGDDTADLEKTADNEWKVETDSSSTDTDDATTDKLIESADYLEDLSDFLQTPTESEPARRDDKASTPAQAEDRVDEIESEIADIEDGLTDDSGENARALNEDETARLAALRTELDSVDQDLEELRGTEGNPDQDIDSAKESVAFTRNRLDELASTEETTTEPEAEARPEIETETGQPVPEYIDRVAVEARDLVEKPNLTEDDKDVLRAIHDDLSALDKAIEDSGDEGYEEDRNRISEISDNIETALAEDPEEETSPAPEDDSPLAELDKAIDDGSLRKAKKGVETLNEVNGKDNTGVSEVSQEEFDALESPVMYRGVSKEEHKDAYYDDVKLGDGGTGEGVYFSDDKAEARKFASGDSSSDNKMIEAKLADDAKVITGDDLVAEVEALPEDKTSSAYVKSLTPTEQAAALGYDALQAERNGETITIVTNPSKLVSPQRDSESETDAPEPKERAPLRGPGADDNDKIESKQEEYTPSDRGEAYSDAEDDLGQALDAFYKEPTEDNYNDVFKKGTKFVDHLQEADQALKDDEPWIQGIDTRSGFMKEKELDAFVRHYGEPDNTEKFRPESVNEEPEDHRIGLRTPAERADESYRTPSAEDESEQTSLPKLSDVSSPDELEWESNDDEDGISQVETAFIADDEDAEHQITTYVDDDNSLYGVTVYPSDSDEDVAGDKLFETREEARQHALDSLKSYESNEDSQDRPATFTPEETEGGYQADPEKVDEELSAPDVETSIRGTQEAAENGTLSVEDVDPSADFTPTPDIEIRKETASRLNDPQEGDISVSSSGRKSEYKSGMWVPVDDDNAPSTSTEAQKKLNANGPETIKVSQDTETEAPRGAVTNRHGVELSGVNSPDFIQVTNQDGTQEVYAKLNGRWHRKLDSQGNYSRNHTDKSLLHAKLNDAPQVATKKKGERPVPSAKVTQAAPEQEIPKEAGLLPGGKHQAAAPSGKRPPLGSNITDRITKGEPNTVLEQDGKRVGFTDSEGTPYYVGDRVIFEDRSKNTRSARVLAVGVKKPKNENEEPRYFLDMAPDENDPETPEGKISFDEWYAMSQKEREDAGYHGLKYSGTKRMFQDSVAGRARHAVSESKEDVANEHARRKEEGLVTGNVVTEPEILSDASIDRVVRDATTRIIGTTNKHGELFQKGDVVEYGPNGEVGTITHIGEADDRIRIAPNGQSALEANFHHVDTIKHSETPATYYDENYDLAPADRVINDRFNQPVMIGDTIYRYGLPFEVKDIYPDGRKVRVVGKDWAGEQGSSASVQHSQLIDLGVDPEMARDLSSSREHDFMPDHIQVFTGDLEDIKSVRTHDSHMMTLTRDENGNVVDTAENRSAATSRAVGTKGNTKQTNSAVARYIAENGDQERYDRAGIKPGDMIDSGVDQAASDNLNQYVNTTFGSDLVIPDNSRVLGYNKYGQYETYTKKDNKWTIDGLEGGYEMSAQEFYQYRLENGYIPSPDDAVGDPDQHRLRLSYLGDADDNVVPRPGSRIKKTDDAAFALMPVGSIVRFEDAEGNIITIRKGSDGKWYRVTSSGAYANNKGPVAPKDLAGTATYRGHYNKEVPLPKKLDTTSDEAKKDQYNRQKRGVARNEDRVNSGGIDRIYSRNTSSESTYRQGREDSKNVKDRRQENESIAQERDNLAKQNAELLAELERLRNQQSGEGDAVTASAPSRIVATRKGTDHVVAVYNRIDGNVWEYTSSKGYRREFVMETVPVTPGITYKVEENIA